MLSRRLRLAHGAADPEVARLYAEARRLVSLLDPVQIADALRWSRVRSIQRSNGTTKSSSRL